MTVPVTTYMLIDPATAQHWLDTCNSKNRPVHTRTVETISDDMKNGRWVQTHQSIGFDVNGQLVDGQHRLLAIIKANVGIPMLVVHNLQPEARQVVDTHTRRTPRDILSIHIGAKQPGLDTAVSTFIVNGGLTQQSHSSPLRLAAYDLHKQAITWACDEFRKYKHVSGVCVQPVVTVFARAWYTQDPAKLADAVRILMTGQDHVSTIGNALVALREQLMRAEGWESKEKYYKTQKALNLYLNGRTVKTLKLHDCDFEEIYLIPSL
jgi:hypothetical protein